MGKQWKQWQTLFWGAPKSGDCSHEIKSRLLLGRKFMTTVDSILKSGDISLSTKVHLVKAMVFPVVMCGCESWTIKTGEHWRIDAEAETPILWPPDAMNWLIWKDSDAGKDWRQEEKGTREDEMVGWHHWLNGHKFERPSGDNAGQRSLECYNPQDSKESEMT